MTSPFYKVGFLLFLAAFVSAIPLIAEENVVDIFKKSSEADLQTAQRLFAELEKYEGPTTVETVLVPLNRCRNQEIYLHTHAGFQTCRGQSQFGSEESDRKTPRRTGDYRSGFCQKYSGGCALY